MYKYLHKESNEWLPIPRKVYPANLPILEAVPALRDHPLIVHHTIGPRKKGWTVTHIGTSAAIAHGETRGHALDIAQSVLLRMGNDAYLAAIAKVEKHIASLPNSQPTANSARIYS